MSTKHVISVGGGLSSTVFLPMEVLKTVPAKDIVMVMAKLPNEDLDVWRLVKAAEDKFGIEVQMIGDNETPFDAFHRAKFLGNSRIDPCSNLLKRQVLRHWVMKNYPLGTAILYTGIGAYEIDRQMSIVRNWKDAGYEMRMPLIDKPELTREYMMDECQAMFGFIPRLYLMGFSHNNCFQRDTRFVTEGGIKTFGETHGQTVKVLTSNGKWIETQVQSFGEQPLWRLTLQRYGETKEIYTTADHRWLTYLGERDKREGESLTRNLKNGIRLASMFGGKLSGVRPSAFGIAHGITFGDGTMHYDGNSFATLTLCGTKNEKLAKWFPLSPSSDVKGVGLKIADLPRYFKTAPPITESKSYLLGWLMGYFAADGSVADDGSAKIDSANRDNLEFVKDVCARLGIGTRTIREQKRIGLGESESSLYGMYFVRHTIPDGFFLIDEHETRHQNNPSQTKFEAAWKVVSVEETDRVETVYCVNVPDTHAFTLEDNILTGNCGGACIKAGMKEWARLLYFLPDVFAWWAENERQFRLIYGDYTILRQTIKGVKRYLTLDEFRTLTLSRWNCEPPDYPMIGGWDNVVRLIPDYDETAACSFCDAIA